MKKLLILCGLLALSTPACVSYTVLSPAEVTALGTRQYGNSSREKLTEATATALATLGYTVTVKQPETGLVKTAPASIMTSATGGRGYANVTEDSLAWSIVVEATGSNVVVHATPRAFRNGSEVREKGVWVSEVMDAKFRDLWREVDTTLGVQPPRT